MQSPAVSPLRSDDGSDLISKSPVAAALVKGVNFRDISQNVECIKPGVVYRSSQVVSTTELAALKIQVGSSVMGDLRPGGWWGVACYMRQAQWGVC